MKINGVMNAYASVTKPMVEKPKAEADQSPPVPSFADQDRTTISQEARDKSKEEQALLEKEQAKKDLEARAAEHEQLRKQAEASQEQAEAMADEMKTLLRCITIANRIIYGHKVPGKDRQYLAKNNGDLYGKALLLRIKNDRPIKFKRLSKDEEAPKDPQLREQLDILKQESEAAGDVEPPQSVPPEGQPPTAE